MGGCGWVIDRKRHRQEIEALKAEIRQKNLDLSTEFVEKFRTLISDPLEEQVNKLRNEVNQLRDAIEGVYDCPYRDECPVRDKLANWPTRWRARQSNRERRSALAYDELRKQQEGDKW